jgi:hypothetical protein
MEVSRQFHAPAIFPGERAPDTGFSGGCVGLRAGLDAVAKKKKIPVPARNINPAIRTVVHTRAVCEVCGLATVRRCYAKGGGDCYVKL